MLAYNTGTVNKEMPLLWLDRKGSEVGRLGDAANYSGIALSADGNRAAVTVYDRQSDNRDLWIFDVARGLRSRFTFDPADDVRATWSPDGKTIYFSSDREGDFDLYSKSVGGGEEEVLLYKKEGLQIVMSVTPDSGHLIFIDVTEGKRPDLWSLPLQSGGEAVVLLQTEFVEVDGRVSPNGGWLAYASNESGRDEVYMTTFPRPGGKWQISTAGGSDPVWRKDGREIVFQSLDDKIMAAAVDSRGREFQVGLVEQLFQWPMPSQRGAEWTMSADGERFLVISASNRSAVGPIQLVLNWQEELERKP